MNKDIKETFIVFCVSAVIGMAFMWATINKLELTFKGEITLTSMSKR